MSRGVGRCHHPSWSLVDLLELNLAIHTHKSASLPIYATSHECNVQDEVRVRGNQAGELLAAVREVAGDVETSLLAELHGDDALVPAYCTLLDPALQRAREAWELGHTLDNAANTNGCPERSTAGGRIELLALLLGLAIRLEPSSVPVHLR